MELPCFLSFNDANVMVVLPRRGALKCSKIGIFKVVVFHYKCIVMVSQKSVFREFSN